MSRDKLVVGLVMSAEGRDNHGIMRSGIELLVVSQRSAFQWRNGHVNSIPKSNLLWSTLLPLG